MRDVSRVGQAAAVGVLLDVALEYLRRAMAVAGERRQPEMASTIGGAIHLTVSAQNMARAWALGSREPIEKFEDRQPRPAPLASA